MTILKVLSIVFKDPLLAALILFALFVLLFKAGMSSGFQGSHRSGLTFVPSLANGWARGWLFLIIPIILWLAMIFLMFFLSGADTGLDLDIPAIIFFFGGVTILILTPGISVAQRIRSQYPTISQRSITVTALAWALIFPISLLTTSAVVALVAHLRLLSSRLTLKGDTLWLAVLALLANLLISKAVGKRVTSWQLRAVIESPPIGDAAASRRWTAWIPSSLILWGERIAAMPSSTRAKIGWAIIWIWLGWAAVENFDWSAGLETTELLLYAAGFSLIIALLVSGGAGAAAAILLRNSSESWRQTLKTAKTWIIAGLRGWESGLFIGWMVALIYRLIQTYVMQLDIHFLTRVVRATLSSQRIPFLLGGVIAMLMAYNTVQREITGKTTQPLPLAPITKGIIGWLIVGMLLTWVFGRRFAVYGNFSAYDILWMVIQLCLLTAFIVSISAGLVAALLMRMVDTPWSQTWRTAGKWAVSGFVGWGGGVPIGWLAVMAYQQVFNLPSGVKIKSGMMTGISTPWNETVQMSLLMSGIIALIIGIIIFRQNTANINTQENNKESSL